LLELQLLDLYFCGAMDSDKKKKAIIVGAGPAGLTAALELLRYTDIIPIVLEAENEIGGISKTVKYKGNRMDIGGHRFFSKSETVMNWWLDIFPIEKQMESEAQFKIQYQNKSTSISQTAESPDPNTTDVVMLVRNRLSRIFYLRKFFPYPINLSVSTLKNLGISRTMRIGFSYIKVRLFPIKEEKSLEDFLINRFGMELYKTFFRDYTEKVWGLPCSQISAEWGAQRIKGVSISKAIKHALKSTIKKNKSDGISQKNTETSLIEKFLYPKLGPGQLWEEVARQIEEKGGIILKNHPVAGMQIKNNKIAFVTTTAGGTLQQHEGDYFFSTMPVKELIAGLHPPPPENVREIASNLQYRDFITVGLLVKKLAVQNVDGSLIKDNWIYIQESDVKIGRLQVFNNWSPYMVADSGNVWLGLEYFCNEGDDLWNLSDKQFLDFAISELCKINIIESEDVLDGTVVRVPKTYPAYFGAYERFGEIREFTDTIENLFLVGRNGMHKYNNQDHSMLTAITAVQNIKNEIVSKDNIWKINTEMEYHEEK